MTDAITIQNPRNRGGSTGHVLAKRSVTFTEIRNKLPKRSVISFEDELFSNLLEVPLL